MSEALSALHVPIDPGRGGVLLANMLASWLDHDPSLTAGAEARDESEEWGICLTQVTPIRCGSRLPKPVPRPPDAPCLAQNGVLKGPGYENAFESFSLLCCFAGPIQAPACPIWRH